MRTALLAIKPSLQKLRRSGDRFGGSPQYRGVRFSRSWLTLAVLLGVACRVGSGLSSVGVSLLFSSPDQPAALLEPDAGLIELAFGSVVVGTTKTLTIAFASIGGDVSLGSLTPIQPDSEFSLPFPEGAQVSEVPSQITASFSPTTLGDKSAVFQLAYSTPDPRTVTFELSGTSLTNGLVVTPDPVDFGQVEVNQSDLIAVVITNQSPQSVELTVSALDDNDAGAFLLGTPFPPTLAPGASATLNAAFEPLRAGPAGASFALNGWATNPIQLTGSGAVSCLQITSPLDFGFVQPRTFIVKPLVITNACQVQTFHLTRLPYFNQPDEQSAFHLAYPVPDFPGEIPPGQSFALPLSFAPTALGYATGTLTLTTDDPLNGQPLVQLEGWGGGPKISCPSPLLFGPVAAGFSATQFEICTNAGSVIPYHPEFGLELVQGGIAVDDPAFTATLMLPDGGPASLDAGLFLSVGQSATIQVTFRPVDAGAFGGRLSLLGEDASDINDADAGVLVLGEGVTPGPCELELLPAALSFDEVPAGAVGVLQAEVDNVGQDFCILTDVSLDPVSDRAFSVWDGGPGYTLLSFQGNTDNPAGLLTSLRADVQFAPTAVGAAASGELDFTVLNAAPPKQVVPLTGVSQSPCLTIMPSSHDFGEVGFNSKTGALCVPASQGFSVLNVCDAPVTVTGLALDPGLDAVPQFELKRPPAVPTSIAPGTQVTFQASFVPSSLGETIEAVYLTSSEFPATPYLISLEGNTELAGTRTDSFIVPQSEVDIVWILDNDDDYPQVQNVRAILPQLFASLDEAQVDYQMAVTSTDTCNAPNSDRGSFEPCDHCLSTASPDPIFISPVTPDPAGSLSDLFGTFDIPPQLGLCAHLNGDEHFFDSIAAVLSPALLSGHNAGFFRPEAFLALILVNGDDEDDAYDAPKGLGPYVVSLARATSLVRGFKPDSSLVTVNYLNEGVDSLGDVPQSIGKLVAATNGIEIDTNQASGTGAFLNLFASTEGIGVFRLSTPAIYTGPFQVEVNGVAVDGWTYDRVPNEIVFTPGQLPVPGATVTVTYPFECE